MKIVEVAFRCLSAELRWILTASIVRCEGPHIVFAVWKGLSPGTFRSFTQSSTHEPIKVQTMDLNSSARRKSAQGHTLSDNLPCFNLSGDLADYNPERCFETSARR